jgi:hypothetical protein
MNAACDSNNAMVAVAEIHIGAQRTFTWPRLRQDIFVHQTYEHRPWVGKNCPTQCRRNQRVDIRTCSWKGSNGRDIVFQGSFVR